MTNIDIKQSMDVASKVFQEPNLSYSFLEHIPIPHILVPRKPKSEMFVETDSYVSTH